MARERWSKLYDKKFSFMEWTTPIQSVLLDNVSGTPFSHITLLFKHMLCVKSGCLSCKQQPSDPLFYQRLLRIHGCHDGNINFVPSGSYAEGCPLPPFFVKCNSNAPTSLKCSDYDFMVYDANDRYPVGFDPDHENNIKAVIDTKQTQLGYLRLRGLDGEYIRNEKTRRCLEHGSRHLFANLVICNLLQHQPVFNETSLYPKGKCDIVPYYPCNAWPPQAKSWIDRKRHSNWPTRPTIERCKAKGCAVVSKVHLYTVQSSNRDIEFRMSFSFAEKLLFANLSADQKQCFVAFKTIIKFMIYSLEANSNVEIGIKSYHLKTIFLWACETIEVETWKTSSGWAQCLLFLINQFQICLETMFLPSYFIPEWNILDEIHPSIIHVVLKNEIDNFLHDPLKYAGEILDSLELGHLLYPRTFFANHIVFLRIPVKNDSISFHSKTDIQSFTNATNLGSGGKKMFEIHKKEGNFFRKIFQTCEENLETISRCNTFINRAPCSIHTAHANWWKEVFLFWKIDNLILRDLINQHDEQDPGQTEQIHPNLNWWDKSDTLSTFVLLVFNLIKVKQYEQAKNELCEVIYNYQDKFKLKSNKSFTINLLVSEFTGYESSFNRTTLNAIREQTNIHESANVEVSVEILLNYLLSKCYYFLGDKNNSKSCVNHIYEIHAAMVPQQFDFASMLFIEVSEMCDNRKMSYEMLKSILTQLYKTISKNCEALSKLRSVWRDKIKFPQVWDFKLLDEIFLFLQGLPTVTVDNVHVWQSLLLFLKQIHKKIGPNMFDHLPTSKLWKLIAKIIDIIGYDTLRELFRHALPTDDKKPSIAAVDWFKQYEIIQIVSQLLKTEPFILFKVLSELKALFQILIENPTIRTIWEILPHLKDLTGSELIQIFREKLDSNKKCNEELHEMNFSGNMLLRNVLCIFPIFNRDASIPDIEFQTLENLLLSNDSNTIADRVYICQMKIHRNHLRDSIPILDQVVSEEIVNPMSIVIWHEDFDTIVDDNVKAEIHKSTTKCIVVPSVVFALYLLASVHESLGNYEAYSETMKRFEALCDYFGNVSTISQVLLEYARHRSSIPRCCKSDFELD